MTEDFKYLCKYQACRICGETSYVRSLNHGVCYKCMESHLDIFEEVRNLRINFNKEHIYLYFIDSPVDEQIKIGVSVNPYRRIEQLIEQQKKPLYFLGFYPGSYAMENNLHQRFKSYNVLPDRRRSEWYHKVSEIMDFIKLNTVSLQICNFCFKEAWFSVGEIVNKKYGSEWLSFLDRPSILDYEKVV